MSKITEREPAVEERMAQRGDADRPVTRFGRSGRRKVPPVVRRGPMPEASQARDEAVWPRYGGGETSRFGRGTTR